MGDDAGMDAVAPAGQIGAGGFDVDGRFMAEITAGTAVFFGDGRAEQAQLTRLLPGLAVHLALLAPFLEFGGPFGGDE